MSGIPIYTAENPTGVTPQSALPPEQTSHLSPSKPPSIPAGPTTVAAAAPTQASQPFPSQTQPTPTRTVPSPPTGGPPPPRPGAVPTLPQPTSSRKTTVPPPPKAGELIQPPEYYAPVPTATSEPSASQLPKSLPYQWQQEVSNPTRAQPPASTTSAYETGRRSLEHPPGYLQNPNVGTDNVLNEPVRPLEGLGFGGGDATVGDEPGVWDTAKKWATDTAGKVREMEEEIWRRIN